MRRWCGCRCEGGSGFGVRGFERSLLPGEAARLGRVTLEEWSVRNAGGGVRKSEGDARDTNSSVRTPSHPH